MGELKLIEHFRTNSPTHPWVIVGPGQDCAVLRWPGERDQAFKIDQIVEGTHFHLTGPNAATPKDIGWKSLAKACSDIAATGFWPVAATVAVNLRRGSAEQIALDLFDGIADCCKRFSIGLAGGDFAVSENGLAVTVSLVGEGPKGGAWTRDGARPGDTLLVTGTLGASLAGKHLHFMPRLEESRKIRQLAPNGVHACIDVTDGLSRDLKHICIESACGAIIMASQIPCSDSARKQEQRTGKPAITQALGDGEDFELLLAVEPAAAARLLAEWKENVPLTQIGSIQPASSGILITGNDGITSAMPDVGYEHTA